MLFPGLINLLPGYLASQSGTIMGDHNSPGASRCGQTLYGMFLFHGTARIIVDNSYLYGSLSMRSGLEELPVGDLSQRGTWRLAQNAEKGALSAQARMRHGWQGTIWHLQRTRRWAQWAGACPA